MAQLISDRKDIDFVLYEQLDVEQLTKTDVYAGQNKKMYDMVINEARNFAIKEILPTYAEGDKEGVRFENGQVKVPECFRKPHKLFVKNEWTAMTEAPELGGQGLPNVIAQAAAEYVVGANFAFAALGILGHGTGKMIEIFGTEKQKKLFLKKLYTGEWAGTMLLTEPSAGSDVGALTTCAVKNPDGTYSITGNKIFITNGDHDLNDNIIHPVLARIEGAPKGTKGISLFIVPKYWVHDDGSIGEFNDIVCTGVEEKMGIHGSPTCSLTLGGKGKCRGLLLGEENKGMKVMFHMMNEARLGVGAQGYLHGSSAYLYALNYARERLQGRALEKMLEQDSPQVPIIQHPDIRRMLLNMKSYVDGMKSFILFVAYCFDKLKCNKSEEEKTLYEGLIEILTPVVKAYCTERGFEICEQAMQVYGGYGYTREYPIEQLLRDCKISSIYEGSNGIQAMDLLGRKLGMRKGMFFMSMLNEINKTVSLAKGIKGLENMASKVSEVVNKLGETAMHLGKTAMSPDFKTAFAFAHPFLTVTGDVVIAWMLLWRAVVSAPKLEKADKNAPFYEGQILSAEHFIYTVLPVTIGKMNSIMTTNSATIKISEKSFGGY